MGVLLEDEGESLTSAATLLKVTVSQQKPLQGQNNDVQGSLADWRGGGVARFVTTNLLGFCLCYKRMFSLTVSAANGGMQSIEIDMH